MGALCDGEELGGRDPLDGTDQQARDAAGSGPAEAGKPATAFGDQKMAAVDDDCHERVDHDVGAA